MTKFEIFYLSSESPSEEVSEIDGGADGDGGADDKV
jgi:hypothetical protein